MTDTCTLTLFIYLTLSLSVIKYIVMSDYFKYVRRVFIRIESKYTPFEKVANRIEIIL